MKKPKNPVVALGIFDGVHIGHAKVLNEAIKRANAIKGTSVALTFSPHPLEVLSPKTAPPLLTSIGHRIKLIISLGVDLCCPVRFDKKLSNLTPDQFVRKILVDNLGAKEVVVGYDYAFGNGRKGNIATLKELGKRYGFKVREVKPVKVRGIIVSSSRIRTLIESGGLQTASSLLGRPVSILGTVVKGDLRARRLGYPTANIKPEHEVIPPPDIYAVMVKIGGVRKRGILYIGTRPTFPLAGRVPTKTGRSITPVVEVHILDYCKKIYGKVIEVLFIKRLRSEKKFKNQDDLIKQIKKDEKEARSYFSLYKP